MYKIYINESPLILCTPENTVLHKQRSIDTLIMPYTGRKKQLFQYIDLLEKSNKYTQVIIHHPDQSKLWKDFISLFEWIEAAGGLVTNSKSQILMIYRRGFWDLPKGKKEALETNKECALREVKEECGLREVTLGKKITKSYHVYRTRGRQLRMLKKTNWYHMTSDQKKLVPQAQEKIEKAKWIAVKDISAYESKAYNNIVEVIQTYLILAKKKNTTNS